MDKSYGLPQRKHSLPWSSDKILQGDPRIKEDAREDLVSVTGHYVEALILQRFMHWTGRRWDYDQFRYEELSREEREVRESSGTSGWVQKTVDDLHGELVLRMSRRAIRRHLRSLVRKGYLNEREDPVHPWRHSIQYRVNLVNLQKALARRKYPLDESLFD